MSDGALIFDTGIDSSGFKSALTGLSGMAVKAGAAVGAALSAAFVGSVAVGGNYETSLAKVGTIADTTKVSLTVLSDSIKSLSKETGASASELNETLYQAISAGADTAHAVDLVETATKAAKAGFTDATTAVDGLTSALNAYGMETTDAEGLANKFLITQNLGKTSFGELASSIGTVAPTANAAGVSIDELLASVTSLTANGIATSEAMTGLKAIMSNIIKPTSEASDLAKELGINFSASALKSMGFTAFLEDIKEKTGGDTEKMSQLFGSVEALNSVLTLTSEQGTELMNSALEEMATNTTALDTAYAQMTDTFDTAIQKMLNSAKLLGIAAFDNIKEPLKNGAEAIQKELEDLSKNAASGELSETLKSVGEGISAILPMALELVTDVLPEVVSLVSGITNGIVLLTNGFKNGNIEEGISKITGSITEAAKKALNFTAGVLPAVADAAVKFVAQLVSDISTALPELIPVAVEMCYTITEGLIDNLDIIVDAAIELATGLADGLIKAIPIIVEKLPVIIEKIVSGLIENVDKITLAATEIAIELAAALLSTDWNQLGADILIAVGKGFADGFENMLSPAKAAAKKAIEEESAQLEKLRQQGEQNVIETNKEIAVIAQKADKYEELRLKVKRTVTEEETLKTLAGDLQEILPDNITLINEETGAYEALDASIADVTSKMRAQAILKSKQGLFEEASVNIYNYQQQLKELDGELENLKIEKLEISGFDETLGETVSNLLGTTDIAHIEDWIDEQYGSEYNSKTKWSDVSDDVVNYLIGTDIEVFKNNEGYYVKQKAIEDQQKFIDDYNQTYEDLASSINTSGGKAVDAVQSVNSASDAALLGFGTKQAEQISNEKEQVIDEIDNAAAEISDAFKAQYEQLQTDRIYGTKSEAEYYAALESLLDEYHAYGNSAYNSYYSDLFNYQKSAEEDLTEQAEQAQQERLQNVKDAQKQELSSVKSTLSDIVSTYKQQYNAVLSEQKSYTDGIRSQLDLFKKEETDDKITYSLENLADYKKAVAAYTSSIKKLKERGVNDALISEIQDAGMEDGTAYAKILLSKSDEELKELNDTYAEIDSMIEQSGKDIYGSQLDSINQNFVSEVSGLFGSLPAEIQGIGLESALAFAQGLNLSSEDAIAQTEQFCDNLMTTISDGIDNGTVSTKGLTDNIIADFKAQTPDVLAAVSNMLNFDGLSAKVKAAVAAEVSATSTAGAAGAGEKSYAKPEENQVQNGIKGMAAEFSRFLFDINKPLNIFLEKDKLGNAVISFANLKSRQTGRSIFI